MLPFFYSVFFPSLTNRHKFADEREYEIYFLLCLLFYIKGEFILWKQSIQNQCLQKARPLIPSLFLSYKDDETEKIITHTISKVGRSFVYDEKETKYHYSNKYKAFILLMLFIISRQSFPTEKAVQEYLSAADYILT